MTPLGAWTKADFDDAYSIRLERYTGGHPNTRAEKRGHYERRALFNAEIPQLDYVTPEWDRILDRFRWPLGASLLVVGCGFGWTLEYLRSRGYTRTWGVEPSTYIQAVKGEVDPADGLLRSADPGSVLDRDLNLAADRDQLVADTIGGGKFDVSVTERVMSSLVDADALTLRDNIAKIGTQIVHIEDSVSATDDGSKQVWRTLSELKTLFPEDDIVRSFGGEFL